MRIGSYFGGVNYSSASMDLFRKNSHPRDDIKNFGRRVREFSNDGTVWIGTEDKGLFHFIRKWKD